VWSALQESDCSNAGSSAVAGTGTFHQDSVSAALASLLVRVVCCARLWFNHSSLHAVFVRASARGLNRKFIASCIQVMMSLVYSSVDASTRQSAFSLDSSDAERPDRAFSFPLFHAVFSLGSMCVRASFLPCFFVTV